MKVFWIAGGVYLVLALSGPVYGQTGYSITGGMSNFDCGNHCDEPCDEFEVEIEDIHPEDVVHCYHNGNYGSPTVTLSDDGLSTIIDYRNPQHLTAVGAIEHFGITLRQLTPYNAIRVRWMVNGAPATVNGQVPLPGGGSAPATQPMLPSISADMDIGSTGGDGISCTVTNNDPLQWIWIKRRGQVTQGSVNLEQLMPNDPVVTTTVPFDNVPMLLAPGQSVTVTNDLVEVEDNQTAVFAAEYFQDLGQAGPFNNNHVLGPSLGNVMTASIASPGTGCEFSKPVVLEQPVNVTAAEGHSADLRINADGNDLTLSYQWMREGADLADGGMFHGVTSDELSIDEVTSETEGLFICRIWNTCGVTYSQSALVYVEGHNVAPVHVCQPAAAVAPTTASVCSSGFATYTVVPSGTTPMAYEWQIATDVDVWEPLTDFGVTLACGGEAYADTPNDAVTNIFVVPCDGVDAYTLRCALTNECSNSVSELATMRVFAGIPGDMNADFELDGADIQLFVNALLEGNPANASYCAADLSQEGVVDLDDVELMVDALLNW